MSGANKRDDVVPNSVCPMMTRPMMVPTTSQLGQPGVTIKAVEAPCLRTCMLYEEPSDEDKFLGRDRGTCKLGRRS